METKIAVFKGKQIRKTIHNNEWWFVVEDVVLVLTDTVNVKDYINKMRRRDEELSKGYGQIVHTLLIGVPGRAHLLGDESPLQARQRELLAGRQGCRS
jgi:prophage antirepressor-like protein